ncbi:NAD(P)H-binding protein [Winogradskya consettensis]|uniref:NmrA family transcriptional regulator n=1 Tax=Winogradskya consettensis TaxID=113560 RepID=A0A919VP62_9ACTN|nr:NmrA family NAD(P)-binding protein [Actinoplanes consettensis]GIM70585.1 NmrA family transcriptional regulator [Actinoplanes consettensis]
MIVITGATGALNGATVDHLLTLVPAAQIAVVARDVTKAQRFADLGVEVRHGDYADPAGLPAAFEGADQLLLVSSSDPKADAVALHGAAIDAAVAAKAGRILYTSHQNALLDTAFKPGRDHGGTEQLLQRSGIAWTSLRNGFYAHSLAWMTGPWRETGVIAVPGDGPVSWTARDDSAQAAAVILAAGTGFDGPVTITANAAPTFAELAATASELAGRSVVVELLDDDAWLAAQVARGTPEFMARFLLGFYQAARRGDFAGVDPLLATLLGREPQPATSFL